MAVIANLTVKLQADIADLKTNTEKATKVVDDFGGRIEASSDRMEQFSASSGTAANAMRTFDGVLGAAGVHIGAQIKLVEDLAAANARGAGSFSLLEKAGLAAGAALGGWKIGRMLAEWTGSDKIIADATQHVMGWGASAEEAAYRSDQLALATQRSGLAVTSLTQAIQINTEWMDDYHLRMRRSKDAAADSAKEISGWRKQIAMVREDGNLESLKRDIESHAFSLDTLSRRYGITGEALNYYMGRLQAYAKADAEAVKDAEAATRIWERMGKTWEGIAEITDKMQRAATDSIARELERQRQSVQSAQEAILAEMNKGAQARTQAALSGQLGMDAQLEALAQQHQANLMRIEQMGRAASENGGTEWLTHTRALTEQAEAAFQQAWDAIVAGSNQEVVPALKQQEAAVSRLSDGYIALANSINEVLAVQRANAANLVNFGAQMGLNFGTASAINSASAKRFGLTLPQYAGGTSFHPGGMAIVGERGPEIVTLPRGASVTPTGAGGTVVYATIAITGSGASAGREAADALAERLRAKGVRL